MGELNWSKWGKDFYASIVRHIATAGLTALSACLIDNKIDWKKFGAAILLGGVIPSTLTFLQKSPLPDDVAQVTVTTEVVQTSVTPATDATVHPKI